MKFKRPVILVPLGLLEKIRSKANGFRTKRDVAALFADVGLTYEMLRDMSDEVADVKERKDVESCRYE